MANFNLKNKKTIIFGIANEQSVAWHIAKSLNENGVRIAAGYQERNKESAKPLIESLNGHIAMQCDVADDSSLDAFFEKVKQEFKTVDFLIHSIAFAKKEFLKGKYFQIDKKGYRTSQEVSVYSLAELTKRTYPLMNNNGSIITMTYIGSQRVSPGYNIMGVCKAALEASVRYLANDVGDKKIRVNAISFGPIKTSAASVIAGFDKKHKRHAELTPLGRNINADDVANLALFLCSDLSKNITGQTIFVDAGYNIVAA